MVFIASTNASFNDSNAEKLICNLYVMYLLFIIYIYYLYVKKWTKAGNNMAWLLQTGR